MKKTFLLLVISITIGISSTQSAFASTTKTFVEDFHSTKYRDTKATTANWDTVERHAILPFTIQTERLGTSDGVPTGPLSIASAPDGSVLIGSYSIDSSAHLTSYANGVFTDLTHVIGQFPSGILAIGNNGSYWLIGGPGLLLKYDGTTVTDLSTAYIAAKGSNQSSIIWNGSYWMIGGTSLVKFDGSSFTAIPRPEDMPYENRIAWDGKHWLIAYQGGTSTTKTVGGIEKKYDSGTYYTFDGTTLKKIGTNPKGGTVQSIASDNKKFLVSGWNEEALKPTLYLYNATTKIFTDRSSVVTKQTDITAGCPLWTGKYWLLCASDYYTNPGMLFRTNRTASKSIRITAKDNDQFIGSAKLLNGWVAIGKSQTITQPFLIRGTDTYHTKKTAQSKTVVHTKKRITKVKLEAKGSIRNDTAIGYEVSTDNGKTWKSVTSGKTETFDGKGKDLRWRATLTTINTDVSPAIQKITLRYTTE